MIKLKDLITEDKGGYDYGCAMLYFEPNNEIVEFQKNINPDDLYIAEDNGGYGIETEPHCTLLYGLHEEVSLDDVKKILDNIVFGYCRIHNPSLFENEKFDVLKFDVGYTHKGGAFLHNANRMLSTLPHTTSYPDYHPHMTLAYLKPGKGKEYVESLGGTPAFMYKPTHLVYSQPDGTKTNIDLRQNKNK
jgi:2'-5' RNA ligase